MSATAKTIEMIQAEARKPYADKLMRLRALADKWDEMANGEDAAYADEPDDMSEAEQTEISTLRSCADQLRREIDGA